MICCAIQIDLICRIILAELLVNNHRKANNNKHLLGDVMCINRRCELKCKMMLDIRDYNFIKHKPCYLELDDSGGTKYIQRIPNK